MCAAALWRGRAKKSMPHGSKFYRRLRRRYAVAERNIHRPSLDTSWRSTTRQVQRSHRRSTCTSETREPETTSGRFSSPLFISSEAKQHLQTRLPPDRGGGLIFMTGGRRRRLPEHEAQLGATGARGLMTNRSNSNWDLIQK